MTAPLQRCVAAMRHDHAECDSNMRLLMFAGGLPKEDDVVAVLDTLNMPPVDVLKGLPGGDGVNAALDMQASPRSPYGMTADGSHTTLVVLPTE
jgi:hypothetical protein